MADGRRVLSHSGASVLLITIEMATLLFSIEKAAIAIERSLQ